MNTIEDKIIDEVKNILNRGTSFFELHNHYSNIAKSFKKKYIDGNLYSYEHENCS